jgi:hypothetical protein
MDASGTLERRVCEVCWNLNPGYAPGAKRGDGSWLSEVYKDVEDIPASIVRINDSKSLIKEANAGCAYCRLITMMLTIVCPKWKRRSKGSFVNLYLAPGFPIVLRLIFGGFSTFEEGGTAYSITASSSKPEQVEIEFYLLGDETFPSLLPLLGKAPERSLHGGIQDCVHFIRREVENCMLHHAPRCPGQDLPLLPDRVLRIHPNSSSPWPSIRLIEPKDLRERYITLSYCWGKRRFITEASNVANQKVRIDFRKMPPLFQDVVLLAVALGIQYVWIDALCIIQGDKQDFQEQGPKMGQIYSNSTFTVAAACANSPDDRIFNRRSIK